MDRVNNRFKDCKALRGQADTGTNYNAGKISRGQMMLHRLPGRSISTDVADIALPSPVCHLSQRKSVGRDFGGPKRREAAAGHNRRRFLTFTQYLDQPER